MNCFQPKTSDRYADQAYCLDCETAVGEANQYIAAEHIEDFGERSRVRQEALLRRRKNPMNERHDPRRPFSPVDTTNWDARQATQPGSTNDPRRG